MEKISLTEYTETIRNRILDDLEILDSNDIQKIYEKCKELLFN